MKVKSVSQVVAVIGLIALSVTLAQAGGGQGGGNSALSNLFECRGVIGGENVGDNVTILGTDLTTVLEQNAIVGMTVLACRQVVVFPKGQQQPLAVPFGVDHLTCYNLAVQGKSADTKFTYLDAFFPSGLNLTAHGSRYLCSPAEATNPQ